MLPQFRKPDSEASKVQSPAPMTAASAPSISGSALGPRPAAPSFRNAASGGPSVIGADLVIQGNLISKGEVQVEGEVQGDIHGTNVVIGEKAKITGGIIAEECVIRGHVLGTVRGRRVLLQSTSHVEGDIYHQTVAIEQGAFFEGKSRRSQDPTAGFTRPVAPQTASSPAPAASFGAAPGTEEPAPANIMPLGG